VTHPHPSLAARPRAWVRLAFCGTLVVAGLAWTPDAQAQLNDLTQTPNTENEGIRKSLADQTGAGRGDILTPGSSAFIIKRDPFRSIRRGRQLFQRKFTLGQGLGPRTNDGVGDIETDVSHGAGLADSCAACHGRPRGSAGAGGDVFTRPDSRDAPHLFGLGLVEMLADEMTGDLRALRASAVAQAQTSGFPVVKLLNTKGINFGALTAFPNGFVNTSFVKGVNPDLRVRPFFHQGGEFSIRAFAAGAFKDEMGLQAFDPDLATAHAGGSVTTPAGLVLDGSKDQIPGPAAAENQDPDADGVSNEITPALLDHMEFYLLNYFKAGVSPTTSSMETGFALMQTIGCTSCHVRNLTIDHDRRVADVETVLDPVKGNFNRLFSTASAFLNVVPDGSGHPPQKLPAGGSFVVKNFFSDLKRHDLGPNFWERNFNGTITKEFVTEPLWGAGTTAPYGHDGRSINLNEVILRHGGEAQISRNLYAALPTGSKLLITDAISSLVLFPPDDTASNLNPGDRTHPLFPQKGHGSIALTVLFNDPTDVE
jgi:hypothetical protein